MKFEQRRTQTLDHVQLLVQLTSNGRQTPAEENQFEEVCFQFDEKKVTVSSLKSRIPLKVESKLNNEREEFDSPRKNQTFIEHLISLNQRTLESP